MTIDYNWQDFAEHDFPPSQTMQDAEMTIQTYLSLTASGTPVPVHSLQYQSEASDKDISFEDLDQTQNTQTDIYDLKEVIERRAVRFRDKEGSVADEKPSFEDKTDPDAVEKTHGRASDSATV